MNNNSEGLLAGADSQRPNNRIERVQLRSVLYAGVLLLMGSGVPASADQLFNFNSLASYATSTDIKNYMNGICGNCVTSVTGAVASRTYNGEGYTTGPGNGSKSLTLGTSDGATGSNTDSTVNSTYDTFISNTKDNGRQVSTQFSIKFASALNGLVSFDFEIFPDFTGSPDFTFQAKNSGGTVLTSWTQLGVTPGTTNGNSVHSPNHQGTGNTNKETSKQYIGTWSGNVTGATELVFIDWPATIGIDNLSIPSQVPEPASVVLLATSFGGLLWLKRKKQA